MLIKKSIVWLNPNATTFWRFDPSDRKFATESTGDTWKRTDVVRTIGAKTWTNFVLRFVTHKLKLEGLKFFRCTLICVHWVNKKSCRNQMIYNLYKDTIILNGCANKTSPKGKKIILNFWSRKKLNNMCAFDQKTFLCGIFEARKLTNKLKFFFGSILNFFYRPRKSGDTNLWSPPGQLDLSQTKMLNKHFRHHFFLLFERKNLTQSPWTHTHINAKHDKPYQNGISDRTTLFSTATFFGFPVPQHKKNFFRTLKRGGYVGTVFVVFKHWCHTQKKK